MNQAADNKELILQLLKKVTTKDFEFKEHNGTTSVINHFPRNMFVVLLAVKTMTLHDINKEATQEVKASLATDTKYYCVGTHKSDETVISIGDEVIIDARNIPLYINTESFNPFTFRNIVKGKRIINPTAKGLSAEVLKGASLSSDIYQVVEFVQTNISFYRASKILNLDDVLDNSLPRKEINKLYNILTPKQVIIKPNTANIAR